MKNLLILSIILLTFNALSQSKVDVKKQFSLASQQYEGMLKTHQDVTKTPQSTNPDGSPKDMPTEWWCSGFFGGSLWYLFEQTKNPQWKSAAEKWTMAIEKEQYNTRTHDLGFMLYCPFGNGYRLTQNPDYKKIMLKGAESLTTRFNPKYGVIKSWDKHEGYDYPVIIDNMMNLEFLFWAARESGDKSFYNVCIAHADSTLKHHFRPDGSSYHVLCYGENGNILRKKTHQGYADESAWARGQAWGLYGYVVMYRETKQEKYLAQAQKIANFYLNHPNLPKDKIPYWDFNAPNIPNEERDASAGAITASALLELSKIVGGKKGQEYFKNAEEMLVSLSSDVYTAKVSTNNNFILMHSTGHKPGKSEIDVPLIYADYYYLEGLLKYQALVK